MRSATRFALAAFALVLWSGSAAAQNDVTFQVDLSAYIATCQFNPATDTPYVRGSFQTPPFSTDNPLTSAGAGIYSTTVSIPEGGITYKFYVGQTAAPGTPTVVGWENGSDRAYTVTPGAQTLPTVPFNGPTPSNVCGATSDDYDLLFQVDMSIQQGRGAFNPGAGDVVAAVGEFQGWDTANPFILTEDSFTPGLYTGVTTRTVGVPSATGFKFIIKKADATITWDSVNPAITADNSGGSDPNRIIRIVGGESDTDGNGNPNWTYDNDTNAATAPFFQDAGAAQFLTGPATVTFNVDLRPAQYRIADFGALPVGDGSPANGNTAVSSVFINGPAAGESNEDAGPAGGIGDWAAWGTVLAAQTTRQLTMGATDQYSITLNYSAGAYRSLIAKFGVNGADDEAGFGLNHVFPVNEGANTFNLSFGCILQAGGSYTDEYTIGGVVNPYDAYLLINNVLEPETCTVVRNGGEGDVLDTAIENGPAIAGLEIGAAYPNPLRGAGRIELTAERAMDVTVRVYDVTGRQVATLLDGRQVAAGTTTLDLDTARLASGVYVLRVEADGQVASRRLTVTR